jgi:YbbR domain-containing protein
MKAQERAIRLAARAIAGARWIAGDVRAHWASALLSLAVAFVIWLIIEDTSDPRQEARAPASSGIPVQAVNVPNGYLEPTLATVVVRVRGRGSDIRDLRPEDFRATADLAAVVPDGSPVSVPVRVTSRRSGVEILEVIPATMTIQLEPAVTRTVEVTARVTASPPAGFQLKKVDGKEVAPTLTPPVVTVTGSAAVVERVARVELDVSLASARTERYSFRGDLVARSADGNVLQVRLSATRAEAVFQIESVFTPRTIGLAVQVTGEPAHGYRVVSVTVQPPTIEVTGPQSVIENLQAPLPLEPIDVSNVRESFVRPKLIDPPDNVQVDVQTAVVRVEIAPIMAEAAVYLAVSITDIPAGLTVLPGTILVTRIVVRGTLVDVEAVEANRGLVVASLSLLGASAGTANYRPVVTAPPGITVVSVDEVAVTLTAGAP